MSNGHKKNCLFVDTGLLRDHVSKLHEEKKLAIGLYENVNAMKTGSDLTISHRYNSILRDIEQLIEYFSRMADLLADIDDDAVHLSHRLHILLEDDTERIRHVSSKNFML